MASSVSRRKVLRRLTQVYIPRRDSCSSSSTDSPLLHKLLKAPLSRIKPTLDSEFSSDPLRNFPWATLLTSLHASASHKANLVVEWRLEKLSKEDEKDYDAYTQLISLCENNRNLPTALLVFTSMEAQGFKPTTSLFNSLISISFSSGNLLTALSLFEIKESSEDYKPDSETYNVFISAYANFGNKSTTEAWFSAKKASGFSCDAQSYGFLIMCCSKSKSFEDVEKYYNEMMLAGLVPDESILRYMLLMYCQLRSSGKVNEFLNYLLDGGWRVDRNIAKKVVSLYREMGGIDELEELLISLTKFNQTSEVLSLVHNSIVRIYADTDRLDDVECSVGRMLKHGISYSCPGDVEKIICSYFRREAYDRLDLFLECVKDSYKLTRSTYDLLGAGYRRAGLLDKLNLVMNEMKLVGFA